MSSLQPLLVVVSGPPGSGKTELSGKLAKRLRLPLISKDMIKETLMDALPTSDRTTSTLIGGPTFALLFAVTRALLQARTGVMIEAPFLAQAHAELEDLSRLSACAIIQCTLPSPLAVQRYRTRFQSGARHPGHADAAVLEDLQTRIDEGWYGAPVIGRPTLAVDTTRSYRPPLTEIVAWVLSATGRAPTRKP